MIQLPNSTKDKLLTLINNELDIKVGNGPFSDKYQNPVPGSSNTAFLLAKIRLKVQHL